MKRTAPAIHHATFIRAAPSRVFETLTTARGWDAWFTSGTLLEPRARGRIELRWRNFGADRVTAADGGPVIEAIPSRRFTFQWSPRRIPTTVSLELEKRGRGTIVRVSEAGYPLDRRGVETLAWCATGWGEALTLLKFYLERGAKYGRVPPSGGRRAKLRHLTGSRRS